MHVWYVCARKQGGRACACVHMLVASHGWTQEGIWYEGWDDDRRGKMKGCSLSQGLATPLLAVVIGLPVPRTPAGRASLQFQSSLNAGNVVYARTELAQDRQWRWRASVGAPLPHIRVSNPHCRVSLLPIPLNLTPSLPNLSLLRKFEGCQPECLLSHIFCCHDRC